MKRDAWIIEWALLMAITLLCASGILLSRVAPDAFERAYVAEDGWIEWLTVVALGAIEEMP